MRFALGYLQKTSQLMLQKSARLMEINSFQPFACGASILSITTRFFFCLNLEIRFTLSVCVCENDLLQTV